MLMPAAMHRRPRRCWTNHEHAVVVDVARGRSSNWRGIEEEQGDGGEAAAATPLDRINYIDPAYDEELHRHLGTLWFDLNNYLGAIREFTAVLAMHPLDQASAQYDLARAYFATGERAQAEEHVLAALETSPSYRPAQKLLLQLENQQTGK